MKLACDCKFCTARRNIEETVNEIKKFSGDLKWRIKSHYREAVIGNQNLMAFHANDARKTLDNLITVHAQLCDQMRNYDILVREAEAEDSAHSDEIRMN